MTTPKFITIHTRQNDVILNTSEIASIEHTTIGSTIRMTVKDSDGKFIEYYTAYPVFIPKED